MPFLLILSTLLALLALYLFWQSARRRKSAGLPGGKIIYADTRSWGPVEKPLFDPDLGLTGKPDYLVQDGERVIPVEVKTGRTPAEPRDSHVYQLAAYCLLVERCMKVRPPYGILHYPERSFSIDFTPALENALLDILAEIRREERRSEVDRSHQQPARCRTCGYRSKCDQKLLKR